VSAAAELAGTLDARGFTVSAPSDHPVLGGAESRWVAPQHLVAAAEAVKSAGFFFESMTCVDRLEARGALELLYTFNRWDAPARLYLRVDIPRGQHAPSLTAVWGACHWNEREAWEFYGLEFIGHPYLTWLLLTEGTEYRPLLKSFKEPEPSIFDRRLPPEGAIR
jgi:NADH-quinone oxidoreductase subunit C